jgi:hypothetical protein
MSAQSLQKIGFWSVASADIVRHKDNTGSPVFFIDESIADDEREDFEHRLQAAQASLTNLKEGQLLEDGDVVSFKGWSTCRFCSCKNGSREFVFGGFVWPEGYCHYIAKHKLWPPAEFRAMIVENTTLKQCRTPGCDSISSVVDLRGICSKCAKKESRSAAATTVMKRRTRASTASNKKSKKSKDTTDDDE